MIIAVASGKGGTGKTSISVNLAAVATAPVQLLDCDVDAPNAHLFLQAEPIDEEIITLAVPEIDETRCDACDQCVTFCQFNALASVGGTPLVFPDLCHACGGCELICPQDAIRDRAHRIGVIQSARRGTITLKTGRLDVGISMASSLVNAVKHRRHEGGIAIIDAPPGTACPAVASMRGADFVVLVTEPTPFGLNDLQLAVDTVRELKLNFGVVINRMGIGDERVQKYCVTEGIPVLLEIADDRRIAEAYSRGQLIVDALPEYRARFDQLWRAIEHATEHEKSGAAA